MYSRHTRNTLTSKRMRRKKKTREDVVSKCVLIYQCAYWIRLVRRFVYSASGKQRKYTKTSTEAKKKKSKKKQIEQALYNSVMMINSVACECILLFILECYLNSLLCFENFECLSLSLLTIRNVLSFIQTVVEFTVVQLCAWVCIGVNWERTEREIERIFDVREHFFEHRIWHLRWSLVCVCVCAWNTRVKANLSSIRIEHMLYHEMSRVCATQWIWVENRGKKNNNTQNWAQYGL